MTVQERWSQSFKALNKRVYSAEIVGAYDFNARLESLRVRHGRILDFGCGEGNLVLALREKGYADVYGCDPSADLISENASKYPFLKVMTDSSIPFPGFEFDLIFCSGVLHHIKETELLNVLEEIHSRLRPGGHFMYIEPRDTWLRRAIHAFVRSPVNRFSNQLRFLAECLDAEWSTLGVWLAKTEREFLRLGEEVGFQPVVREERALTCLGLLKKKDSG